MEIGEISGDETVVNDEQGFSVGYSGIQLNSPVERRFIFSVWSKPQCDHTIYSYYYFASEIGKWNLMVSGIRPKQKENYFQGYILLLKILETTEMIFFKAEYGNQWICTPSGTWIELTKC